MSVSKTIVDFAKDLPRPAVMCTIVAVKGSAPQGPGARMWVTAGRFYGTLGGGELERRALERARTLLAAEQAEPALEEFVLCKELGQCCGGRVSVFFEPARRRRLAHLFGAGHVGRAAAEALARLPFDVRVIDPRPDWAERKAFPDSVELRCEDPVAYAGAVDWGPEDAACVFTHSHDLDLALIRVLLQRPLGYLGLIGSEHKAKVFLARLAAAGGADWEALWEARMHCPIGEPLPGKDPAIIAVAIAAELLREWRPVPAPAPAREPSA